VNIEHELNEILKVVENEDVFSCTGTLQLKRRLRNAARNQAGSLTFCSLEEAQACQRMAGKYAQSEVFYSSRDDGGPKPLQSWFVIFEWDLKPRSY